MITRTIFSGAFGEVAGRGFDGGRLGEFFGAAGAEFGEAAGAGEDRRFEGADGGVVALQGVVEGAADFFEVFGERDHAIVELAAEEADFFGVFRNRFLAPAVSGGFEQGDEGRRRGEEDAFGDGAIHERRIGVEGRAEELVAREKEDDELGGGLELLPVVFRAERIDVAANLLGVLGEAGGADGFVGGFGRGAEGFERSFGVDDDALSAGKANNEVGAERTGGFLFAEIAVAEHVGHFDDAAELEFAPGAGVGGGTQGGGEPGGLGLELELGGVEGAELFRKRAVGFFAGVFDGADLGVDLLEGFAERFDEGVDRLLAFFEVAGGLLLEFAEGFAGEFEEGGVVAREGVGGEGFELVGEAGVGVGECGEFFGGGGALGGEGVFDFRFLSFDFGNPRAERFVFGGEEPGAFSDGGVAAGEEEPDEETGEQSGGEGGDENHVKNVGPDRTWCNPGCVP